MHRIIPIVTFPILTVMYTKIQAPRATVTTYQAATPKLQPHTNIYATVILILLLYASHSSHTLPVLLS